MSKVEVEPREEHFVEKSTALETARCFAWHAIFDSL